MSIKASPLTRKFTIATIFFHLVLASSSYTQAESPNNRVQIKMYPPIFLGLGPFGGNSAPDYCHSDFHEQDCHDEPMPRSCYDDDCYRPAPRRISMRSYREAPLEVFVPMSAESRETKFGCHRRMWTSARIDRDGLLHVDVELLTDPGSRFRGGAVIGIVGCDGTYMWSSKAPSYTLSGNPNAASKGLELKRHWDKRIPQYLLAHTEGLIIINTTEPRAVLRDLLKNKDDAVYIEDLLYDVGAEFFEREEDAFASDFGR